MREARRKEVAEYIESIKDPTKFLEYCRRYHEGERRDIAYVISMNIVS